MKAVALDLVREVLDHELIDVEGVPCGMVDDIELDGEPGKPLRVVALLTGPAVAQARLARWMAHLLRWLFGGRHTRIEWSHVKRLGEGVELDASAAELGLDRIERTLGRWLARLPGG